MKLIKMMHLRMGGIVAMSILLGFALDYWIYIIPFLIGYAFCYLFTVIHIKNQSEEEQEMENEK